MLTVLGSDPEECVVPLVKDGDYNCVLECYDVSDAPLDYPVGTAIFMVIDGDITWNSTVTTNKAQFQIDAAAVATAQDRGDGLRVVVFYENGGDKVPWFVGKTRNI